MVAGPARGAILGACFRPWCDKRRPRSRSRLFLGRPVRHPGTSAVGARAATRHPGNKRQVLLLACLRACPRGGAPTALRPACVVTRLSHACAATQPRRLVCTHSLAIVICCRRIVSPPTLCAPSRVHYVVSVLSRVNAVHTSLFIPAHILWMALASARVLFRRLACTPCCRPPAFCTCPRSPGSLARWPPRYAHVTARASMYHTPRTALRALYHTCTMAWMRLTLETVTHAKHLDTASLAFYSEENFRSLFHAPFPYSCARYVDVMLVSRRLWGGVRASRATCCPPRPL